MLQSVFSLEQFLESLPVACFTCDCSGAITGYNRRAVELWGREPQDVDRFTGALRQYDSRRNLVPCDASPAALLVRSRLSQRNRELVIEKPNGDRVTVLSNVAPLLDPNGAIAGVLSVLQDITDRRWTEDARRVAARLSASARIAAEVARQIRSPLLSMTHLLDLLSQDTTLSLQARGYAQLARGELVHLDKLAKEMAHLAHAA